MVSLRTTKRAPLGSPQNGRCSTCDHKLQPKYVCKYSALWTCLEMVLIWTEGGLPNPGVDDLALLLGCFVVSRVRHITVFSLTECMGYPTPLISILCIPLLIDQRATLSTMIQRCTCLVAINFSEFSYPMVCFLLQPLCGITILQLTLLRSSN